ncbi:MAG: V-type ATPase 116kDa subunit family protein [Bacteroidota bacterium]
MKSLFKKITLLAFHKQREALTETLQDLGVIHLETKSDFRDDDVEELERQKYQIERVVQILEKRSTEKIYREAVGETSNLSSQEVVKEVLELQREKEERIQLRQTLSKDYVKLEPWGDFDHGKLKALAERGVYFHFFSAGKKEFNQYDWQSESIEIIHRGADRIYFVEIGREIESKLTFEPVILPPRKLRDLKKELESIESRHEQLNQSIGTFTKYIKKLGKELIELENRIGVQTVNSSYDKHAENRLISIEGWFPIHMEDRLRFVLDKQKMTYSVSEAQAGDKVPVLLNNAKYPRLFENITKIFELPNYYEMDLTPFIAVFYPILFAYCLGDAGYGLVLLIASLIGWFTFLKTNRNFSILGVILGSVTTAMGIVKSGSVFGLPLEKGGYSFLEFLSAYVIIPDDQDFIFNAFNVALMIGVIQIVTGIIVSIVNKLKYKGVNEALAQFGKLFIVGSLIWIFLGDMQEMTLFQPYGFLRKGILVLGILMVLLFHDMTIPVLKRIASGVLPLFFIFTGILGDVLSYVRLFALGVASSVLGLVVNQIGIQILGNGWWGIIIGIVFLLFGHTLNFGIAILGSFVHPLRLTFVEFYNNAQFEGGGMEYKPFRKEVINEMN